MTEEQLEEEKSGTGTGGVDDWTHNEYGVLMNSLQVSVSKHILDEHFTLVWANNFYYEVIRYPRQEYEEKFQNRPDLYYSSHNYQDELQKITDVVLETLEGGRASYSIDTRMPVKGGGHVWVRMTGTFMDEYINGYQVSYTTITNIDNVKRIQADQSITYNSIPGFAARLHFKRDNTIRVLDANSRFDDFFGEDHASEEFNSLINWNHLASQEKTSGLTEVLFQGKPVQFMAKLKGRAGNSAWMNIRGECVDWLEDEPVYLLIFIDVTDLTDLRRMQSKLEEQACSLKRALMEAEAAKRMAEESNRAKSDFLSRMSHDIRTPMNAIVGMTEIASNHLADPEKVGSCLKKIATSSQHLLSLINDVLDMSRIESGKMTISRETTSMAQVLENTVSIIQQDIKTRKQSFCVRQHGIRHEYVYSDALRLRQVFINILSNASKFTSEGGSITMDVEECGSVLPDRVDYVFTFTDTGVGIKREFLAHLFDAFTRERDSRVDKTEGSGLGMAITKRIVDQLGGTIEVRSKLGEGTVFTVRIPFQTAPAPEMKPDSFAGLRVLVADDDCVACEYMLQMLKDLDIRGEWVSSGEEAFAKIMEAHQQANDFDVVVLDWQMERQDGLQTAKLIREQIGRELPILLVSAYDWEDVMKEADNVGVSGFLTKPVFPSTLCEGLRRYVLNQIDITGRQKEPDDFTGRRFLVIEDNELNREVAEELLSNVGAIVECACDGAEGVEKFAGAPEGYYDLILMDVQMPVMDGYTATRAIRNLPRPDAAAIPILAMTADAFVEDVAAAVEAGMNGHLAKPIELASMRREINRFLGKKAAVVNNIRK